MYLEYLGEFLSCCSTADSTEKQGVWRELRYYALIIGCIPRFLGNLLKTESRLCAMIWYGNSETILCILLVWVNMLEAKSLTTEWEIYKCGL